jgi:hypothetical protein
MRGVQSEDCTVSPRIRDLLGNCLPRIAHKVLNFAESAEHWQAEEANELGR